MTSLGDLAKGIFQKISIFAINAFFGGFCDRNFKKRLKVPENRIFWKTFKNSYFICWRVLMLKGDPWAAARCPLWAATHLFSQTLQLGPNFRWNENNNDHSHEAPIEKTCSQHIYHLKLNNSNYANWILSKLLVWFVDGLFWVCAKRREYLLFCKW